MTVIVSIVTDAGALTRSVQQRDVVYREVVQPSRRSSIAE